MPTPDVDELLVYLHRLIDPHDRLNPKYAYVRAQIDAIVKAKADYLAAQPPKPIIVRGSAVKASERRPTIWVCNPCGGEHSERVSQCARCGSSNIRPAQEHSCADEMQSTTDAGLKASGKHGW